MPNHRDYDNAGAAHRWDRPLSGLYTALRSEAWTGGGKPAWRIRPNGTAISMRTVGNVTLGTLRLEVRFARRGVEGTVAHAEWLAEIGTLVREMGMRNWQRVPAPDDGGDVIGARFVECGIGAVPEPEELTLFTEPVGRAPSAIAEGR